MMNLLYKAIEDDRKNMIIIASKYGFLAKETIKASQELDKLLNMVRLVDTQKKQCENID